MALDLDSSLELSPLHLRVLNFLGEKVDATGDSVCKSLKWTCSRPATSAQSPTHGKDISMTDLGFNASAGPSNLQRQDLDNTLGNVLLDVLQTREDGQDVDAGWELQTLRCVEPEIAPSQSCSAKGRAKTQGFSRALPAALLGVPSPSRALCSKNQGSCRFVPASELQTSLQDCQDGCNLQDPSTVAAGPPHHDVHADLHHKQRLDEEDDQKLALAGKMSLAIADSTIGLHLDPKECSSIDLARDGCAIELQTLRPCSWAADQVQVQSASEKIALPQQYIALPARYANASLVQETVIPQQRSALPASYADAPVVEEEDAAAPAVLPTPPLLPSTPVSWSEAVALCSGTNDENTGNVELLKQCRRGGMEIFIESPRTNHGRQHRLQAEWKKHQQFLQQQRNPSAHHRRHSIASDPGSVSSIAGQVRTPKSRDATPVRGPPGHTTSTSRQPPVANGRSDSSSIDATRAPASARSDRSVYSAARRRASVGVVNVSSLGPVHMQSNRKLIRNALERHCLKGEAARSQREQLLHAFDKDFCTYERFVILFRSILTGRRDFRALYGYSDGTWIRLMQAFSSPARLDERMVAQFFRYDSSSKEFKEVPALQELHVADAVFLQARHHSKSRAVV